MPLSEADAAVRRDAAERDKTKKQAVQLHYLPHITMRGFLRDLHGSGSDKIKGARSSSATRSGSLQGDAGLLADQRADYGTCWTP